MHEKSVPRRGHPATLHLWWARRPLAACRAVLFASLVDDPSSRPDEFPTEEAQDRERQRLFRIIEELVKWENTNNEAVLSKARQEILNSTDGNPPPVLDPFCGGGSIPLEAQRLGLEAHASDLNPVTVLITKALIEIPPKFRNQPPMHPTTEQEMFGRHWKGAQGLAEDVRHYGKWMREEAKKHIGHLYPNARLEDGSEATVIAWLWARTVKCPNPACGAVMPLVRSFALSTKKGKRTWVEPIIDRNEKAVNFRVQTGEGVAPNGTVERRGAKCIVCTTPVAFDYIRTEGQAGRIGAKLMAVVAEAQRGRAYFAPTVEHEQLALSAQPKDVPTTELPEKALGFRVQLYGMTKHADLFTNRQLVALTTFSDLIGEVHGRILKDAEAAGLPADGVPLGQGGTGPRAYADAVVTYLCFALDKLADWSSSICSWIHRIEGVRNTFARHAIPMVWDFVEINPISNSVGNFMNHADWVSKTIAASPNSKLQGQAAQFDVAAPENNWPQGGFLVCTDPPYYDNIGYADLSDFFYIWLRRSLRQVHPGLFDTLLVPKSGELIASPYRFNGDSNKAKHFFETQLAKAFKVLSKKQNTEFPFTLFYAFKQTESEAVGEDDVTAKAYSSTGWETMLRGLISAGFIILGTWPIRSERSGRTISIGTNALASSIVLVCRRRSENAPITTRRDFLATLKNELPDSLQYLQKGSIAPVDLAQSAIGPGISVFSRYSKVIEADGSPMRVRDALALINQVLDEYLAEQESEYDGDTRWALTWLEQFGMEEGPYGVAETLATAKDIAVDGLVEAGILQARGGKVRLLQRDEYSVDWDPHKDARLPVWEVSQRLILALQKNGESGAAELLTKLGGLGVVARDLAYRLYSICERKSLAREALAYNSLVVAWPEITRLAQGLGQPQETQSKLFE